VTLPAAALGSWSTRRLAIVVFAFAFVVRILYLLDIRDNPFFDSPVIDAKFYRDLGMSLARGEGTGRAPFMMPPLFPLLLSLVFRVSPDAVWAPHLLQVVLGAGSAALTTVLGCRLAGAHVGVVAGLLVATSRALLFVEGDLLATAVAVFLDVVFLVFGVRAIQSGLRLHSVALAGLAAGASALARPSVLAPVVVLAAWLAWRTRRVSVPLVLLAATVLPIVPVTLYNARTSGKAVWISANGGINFYLGNNPDMRRTVALRPGPEYRRINNLPLSESDLVHPADRDRWFYQAGLRFWIEQPGRALAHTFEKTVLLVQNHEIMRDFDMHWFAQHYSRFLRLPGWNFAGLFALAIAGWFWGRRKSDESTFLGLFLVTYAAAIVVFFVSARYRAPLLPGLAVLAGCGARAFVRALLQRRVRRLAAMTALGTSAFIVSRVDWYHVARIDEVEARYRVATAYQNRGDVQQALAGYDHVLRLDPGHVLAAARAAQCEQQSGRVQAAIERYERLVQAHPDYVDPWVNLANIAWAHGDAESAEHYFEAAIAADPWIAQSYGYYGMFLASRGESRRAVSNLQKALRLDPAWEALRLDLAHALVLIGEAQSGLRELSRAHEVMPLSDRSELIRGDALWRLGRKVEARAAWQSGLQLNPESADLQRRLEERPPDAAPQPRSRQRGAR
jgi:tetratricopeptide (TPR) repeat protein